MSDALGFLPHLPAPETEAAPVAEPWRDVLNRAAGYIEKHGWCKNHLEDDAGHVCARGAMMRAIRASRADWTLTDADHEKFAQADAKLRDYVVGPGLLSVGDWNNHAERTAAEVCEALRSCARS